MNRLVLMTPTRGDLRRSVQHVYSKIAMRLVLFETHSGYRPPTRYFPKEYHEKQPYVRAPRDVEEILHKVKRLQAFQKRLVTTTWKKRAVWQATSLRLYSKRACALREKDGYCDGVYTSFVSWQKQTPPSNMAK